MDVGIITPRYPPNTIGGGEISVQLLARQLRSDDAVNSVTVYSFDGDTGGEDRYGTPVKRLGNLPRTVELSNLYAARKLGDRVESLDLLHGYNMALHPTVGYLSNAYDIASVATLNSYAYLPEPVPGLEFTTVERIRSKTTRRLTKRWLDRIDTFVGLSQAIIDIYRSYDFANNDFALVPNMLDPSFVMPEASPSAGATDLLFVGNLFASKGLSYLVRAMADLPEEYTLRIAGTGPERETLRDLVSDLALTDRVTFIGSVSYEAIPSVYADADVFVHPGIWPEPFPRTMLEAMQSCLPVVCTDIGAPPDVLPDQDLIAATKDPTDLAEKIRAVDGRETEIGRRNREFVVANYHPSEIVPKMLDLYKSLV